MINEPSARRSLSGIKKKKKGFLNFMPLNPQLGVAKLEP